MSGRGRLGAALAGLALAAPACTVGGGSGTATGELRADGCNSSDSFAIPRPYNLAPTFFAGEPTEDICPLPGPCGAPHVNRLVIRMQHIANRPIEVNDTLFFSIEDAREVARCVRGRIRPDGTPDWNLRPVTDPEGALIPGLPWCDWTLEADPDGGTDGGAVDDAGAPDGGVVMNRPTARIHLSTQDFVRGSLMPLFTCAEGHLTGVSMPGPDSWIDFQDFGSAAEPELPPDKRHLVDNDFKVEFGQRLRARFHIELGDQHVVYTIQQHMAVPLPHIDGVLDGWFDFDLERGRAAQPFP